MSAVTPKTIYFTPVTLEELEALKSDMGLKVNSTIIRHALHELCKLRGLTVPRETMADQRHPNATVPLEPVGVPDS